MPSEVSAGAPLTGRRILIVEDRYLIAAELADEVRSLGGEVVGLSGSLRDAEQYKDIPVDLGLLDVNLGDDLVFPFAEALRARGVPIIFLTGYDEDLLPRTWQDAPRLRKPVTIKALREKVLAL